MKTLSAFAGKDCVFYAKEDSLYYHGLLQERK